MTLEQVLIAPVLSEKSNELREQGKYVFKVDRAATKTDVKEAVRKLFNVKVVDCTVMNVGGKMKRVRSRPGMTASWKKAVVRLAPGETIKVFEGV
ncbi:MAG TPA: 50S ribosomal protein L23 [Treponemataceae bacterium]|jgi:large subunit ribosomal protein L23|nr:50S ribosomal protein L23 [Treponemataceae bacterium]